MYVSVILDQRGRRAPARKLTAGAGQMTESHAKGTNWPVSAKKVPTPLLLALENMYGPLATTLDKAKGKHLHKKMSADVRVYSVTQAKSIRRIEKSGNR